MALKFSKSRILGAVAILGILAAGLCAVYFVSVRDKARHETSASEYVERIRLERSLTRKVDIAKDLDGRIWQNPNFVTEHDIDSLIDLLQNPQDSVREQIAAALGHAGPRARRAVPALKNALSKIICVKASRTSATTIAFALTRMNAPVPRSTCNPYLSDLYPSSRT